MSEQLDLMRFSHSQLTTYTRCGKQYYLERIASAPTKPAVYMVAGTAIHAAIEKINLEYVKEWTA